LVTKCGGGVDDRAGGTLRHLSVCEICSPFGLFTAFFEI
jgi:hypothetical protein